MFDAHLENSYALEPLNNHIPAHLVVENIIFQYYMIQSFFKK